MTRPAYKKNECGWATRVGAAGTRAHRAVLARGAQRAAGVIGLTYGFLANGSRAVVASLWQIEDAPTAQFMEKFYAAYRENGLAADASRLARLDARRSSGSSVWAGLVVRANAFP